MVQDSSNDRIFQDSEENESCQNEWDVLGASRLAMLILTTVPVDHVAIDHVAFDHVDTDHVSIDHRPYWPRPDWPQSLLATVPINHRPDW